MTDALPTSSLQLRSLVTEQGTLELSLVDVPIPSLREDEVLVRIDTPKEREYYRHGGILQYVLRQLVGSNRAS